MPGAPGDTLAAELLQQAAIDYSPSDAKARLKIARLWLEVTESWTVPIVIIANPTILLPEGKNAATFSAKELLSQFGGLLNVTAAWGSWQSSGAVAGLKGTQAGCQAGAKYVEFQLADGKSANSTTVGNVGCTLSHFMRAFGANPLTYTRPDTISQVGLVSINLRLGASYLGGARYRQVFADSKGKVPPPLFGTLQLDASVHLFDQFFMSFGWTASTDRRLQQQGFLGVTISRPNAKSSAEASQPDSAQKK